MIDAYKLIAAAMERHRLTVIEFSGGKDSIAVLDICRPFKNRCIVLHCDMGDEFPHVTKYIRDICHDLGFNLQIVGPSIPVREYTERFGYPSDIVPVWSTFEGNSYLPIKKRSRTLLQSPIECCKAMLWQPLDNAVRQTGATLVIRGSKAQDEHIGVGNSTWHSGIEYLSPIWDWSDEDVFSHLNANNIKLPDQYEKGCNHSLDCQHCTGWGNTQAEMDRLKYTKDEYPVVFYEMDKLRKDVREEVKRQIDSVKGFIGDIDG